MQRISVVAAALLLTACSGPTSRPLDLSETDIGTLAGCPVLPGVGSITVSRQDGPNFRVCRYQHTNTGRELFEVYVGEHPHNPDGLRYAGMTRTKGKDLVWFQTPSGGWGKPRIWHTYLPTGSPRGTVMVVTCTTNTQEQFQALAESSLTFSQVS